MIAVTDLSIRAGSFRLENLNFQVPRGSCAVIMGRTGSGKTSLLEVICGLRRSAGGTIHLNGREVTRLKAADRGIGYVPQDGALFSTMTVRDHLEFSLWIRKWPGEKKRKRVEELAELLHLEHLLDRLPFGLSGGEQRRVALGRALASHPNILCLDEPLSALDDEMREEMHRTLEAVQKYTGVTSLHVTHHREDAKRLANVVLMLKDGKIHPISPEDLFKKEGGKSLNHPSCTFHSLGKNEEVT